MLGTPNENFSVDNLRRRLHGAKTPSDIRDVKQYITNYFAPVVSGVFMWVPSKGNFRHLLDKDVRAKYIRKGEGAVYNQNGSLASFKVQDWFFKEFPIVYEINSTPAKPRVYRNKGAYYVNTFPGFLHPDPRPFHEYDEEARLAVKTIIRHMREVLCSGKKDQEYYLMHWVARLISWRKMEKAIFLHSGQGTGKTMFTNFLRTKVLGTQITHKTANEKVITGSFNKELEGKVLLVLEEMSGSKTGDWIAFANKLKDFIDGDTLMVEEKCKTPYPVDNVMSLIINSNNSKAVRLDRDDRRYFVPDISDKYVGNYAYFDRLAEAMDHPKAGEAFCSYMKEYLALNPKFDERKIPMTTTKQMMIGEAIHVVHRFIKENFLQIPQGYSQIPELNKSSSELYNNFSYWHKEVVDNRKKPPIIQEFSRKLREIGIVAKRKRVGDRKAGKSLHWYQISHSALYEIYQKKGLIDDLENVDVPEEYQKSSIQKPAPIVEKEPAIKKVPPPVPPKPFHSR